MQRTGLMSSHVVYKLTMWAPTLIPPTLCAVGAGAVLTSGQHQSLFCPRNPHEKYAAFLGKLAPEGLLFDSKDDHRVKLQPLALVHGKQSH